MPDESYVSIPVDEYRKLFMGDFIGNCLRVCMRRMQKRGYGVSSDEVDTICCLYCDTTESGERE